MSTAIRRRGGTTAEHATFTGVLRETTIDTDKKTVVVHDGVTAGGFPLAREDQVHQATAKTTPVDADAVGLVDSEASNALKKITWANVKAGIRSALGALIAAATAKTTPVDADTLLLSDSADSDATKKLTWAGLKDTIFSSWGALISSATSKTTPVDADSFALSDSAASDATKKLTWANLKAALFGAGSFTATLTGCTTSPTGTVNYAKIGNVVTLSFAASITGTSNTTVATITGLPTAVRPASQHVLNARVLDNGAAAITLVRIETDGTITLFSNMGGWNFTASGTKGIGQDDITYLLT